jgi:heat shock protein HtpX
MMRILLFLATNMAVLVLVGTVFTLLGFEGILAANGVDLNLQALLVFCGLFGMGGAMVSLFLSKWMAKRSTGAYIIESPRNRDEQWLVDTVAELARDAGIRTPEIGIFPSEGTERLRHRLEPQRCAGRGERRHAAAVPRERSARGDRARNRACRQR